MKAVITPRSSIDLSFKNYNEALQRLATDDGIDASEVVKMLHDANGRFFVDEGPLHDYKREYPFSGTDSIFGSIMRLVCAMHNSYGGVIVFGVHNEEKTAGKNKVIVDSEKINRKIRETLSSALEIRVASVDTPSGSVQLLIVPPRDAMVPPVYPIKQISEYPAGVIYLRKGAEVLKATGADLSFLYGSRDSIFLDQDTIDHSTSANMPPSPATIQEFVGRFQALEHLTQWVRQSRDPRIFLWGQGGSGKSTIAYEFASLISNSGKLLRNKSGKSIDRVIYVSGKAIHLNPHTGKMEATSVRDFDTADGIFKSILSLSGWDDYEKIQSYTYDECISALEDLFDIETQIIVLDDIDTLTTANKDGGMEELFLLLSRAKSGTKVLYTQRGFPSFAPNAAVEVPSLNRDEMSQFVSLCCRNFKVPEPNDAEKALISDHSECRPLAIETLIGMRRITPTYTDAFTRWQEQSGEARTYLFSREYQQLGKDDRARYLLAALSLMKGPQSFATLRDVLQFSPEQLQDAIAEARDMFLKVSPGLSGNGDLYDIGAATRLFIVEMSHQLDMFPSIEARVQHFNSKSNGTPASFIPLIGRAARMISNGNPKEAISFLTKSNLPDAFKEHPEVKALLGRAYTYATPQNVIEARKSFESAYTLGYRHYEMYICWLNLERDNRTEIINGIAVCEKVLKSDGFDGRTRATFRKRLARYQSLKANEVELTSPSESTSLRNLSVLNNVLAYGDAVASKDPALLTYKERAENTISIGLRRHLSRDDFVAFFDLCDKIIGLDIPLNDFCELLSTRIPEVQTRMNGNMRFAVARLNKFLGRLNSLPTFILASECKAHLQDSIKLAIKTLHETNKVKQ